MFILSAAVADYTPVCQAEEKIKKSDGTMEISCRRTVDILKYLGEHRRKDQILCGFSMETERLLENSRRKLAQKGADLIAANSLRMEGAGFGYDTNVLTLITQEQEVALPLLSKDACAHRLLDALLTIARS